MTIFAVRKWRRPGSTATGIKTLRAFSAAQAAVGVGRNVLWLGNDMPRRMRPDQVVTSTITIKNAGGEPLRGEDGVSLTYRWRQRGRSDSRAGAGAPPPERCHSADPYRQPAHRYCDRAADGRRQTGTAPARRIHAGNRDDFQPAPR